MALINNPNLYNGGAVQFDATPFTNFALSMQARRQAKEDALDQYYQNLFKGVNPAGVRTQDMNGFMQKTGEMQQFWQQNKDAIRNPRLDNGRAQTELMSRYQDALAYVQQSKNEEEAKKPILPMLTDPEKRSLVPNSFIQKLALHDLPLGDPRRRALSMSDLDFNPKPLDLDKHLKTFSDIKMDKVPTITAVDGKNMTRTIQNTYSFNDQSKQEILNRSMAQLHSNPSFEKTIDDVWNQIQKEGEASPTLKAYNDTFKKNYGRDIQSEEELAAAYNLGLLQTTHKENEIKDDSFARGKAMAYLNDNLIRGRMKLSDEYARGRMDYKAAQTKGQQEGILNQFIDAQIQESKSPSGMKTIDGKQIKGVTVNNQHFSGTEVRMPQFIKREFALDKGMVGGKQEWEYPVSFLITDDKKYVIPIYPSQKDGEYIKKSSGNYEVDASKSQPILMQDYKGMLGSEWLTKKAIGGEVVDDFGDDGGNDAEDTGAPAPATTTRRYEKIKTQRLAKPASYDDL